MGFELKDALEVVRVEATAFATWFTSALSSPTYIARKAEEWVSADGSPTSDPKSGSQFFVVLAICAVIGATIGAIIPGRPPLKDRFTVFVVVVLVWYFISVLLHGVVRMLGGEGKSGTTVRAMMQLLALVYVVSNLVCLLAEAAAHTVPRLGEVFGDWGLDKPGTIIIGTQFLLLLVYLPLTIRKTHGFRGIIAGAAAGVFGAVCAAVMASLLVAQGNC